MINPKKKTWKIDDDTAREIRRTWETIRPSGGTFAGVAKLYPGLDDRPIVDIVRGKTHRYAGGPIDNRPPVKRQKYKYRGGDNRVMTWEMADYIRAEAAKMTDGKGVIVDKLEDKLLEKYGKHINRKLIRRILNNKCWVKRDNSRSYQCQDLLRWLANVKKGKYGPVSDLPPNLKHLARTPIRTIIIEEPMVTGVR